VEILARVSTAEDDARDLRSRPAGRLRISAPVTLGSHLLVPALAEYLQAHSEVEVELQLNDRIVDLAEEGFDAVFRFGDLPDSGLIARRLRGLDRMICGAPAYLARCGTPQTPADLTNHNCLALHYIQPEREWRFEGDAPMSVRTSGQLVVNNGPALLQAARSGMGIVLLPSYLVSEDIDGGRLIRLFGDFSFARAPLQLVYLPDRHMTPKLKSFIDFTLRRFGPTHAADLRSPHF
jgi:DNA-binding transcriptional LysR family regulator